MRLYLKNVWRVTQEHIGVYIGAVFVIVMGLLIMISMLDVYMGLKNSVDDYYEEQNFADVFAEVEAIPHNELKNLESIDGIAQAFGRLAENGRLKIEGKNDIMGLHILAYDRDDALNRCRVTAKSEELAADEILIGPKMLAAHGFAPGDVITVIINGQTKEFTIVGTVQEPEYIFVTPEGVTEPDYNLFDIAAISQESLETQLQKTGFASELGFKLEAGTSYADIEAELTQRLAPYGLNYIIDHKNQRSNVTLEYEFSTLSTMAQLLPPFFFGVSIFMLYIILRKCIEKDRSAIGTMKAFGYKDAEIITAYVLQAICIGLLGGVISSFAAMPISNYLYYEYSTYFNLPNAQMEYFAVIRIAGIGAAVLACCLSVLAGVKEVLKTSPADAMRSSGPADISAISLPAAIAHKLSIFARMSVRSLSSSPLRSGVIVFAVAFPFAMTSVVVSVSGTMEQMYIAQFDRVETYDMCLWLKDAARVNDALNSMDKIDYIYDVEAIATHDVEMRHENHKLMTELNAVNPHSSNRKIMDSLNNFYEPSDEGITLNRATAGKLGAEVGDWLKVTHAYLKPQGVYIPIVRIVEESTGGGGYITLRGFANFMNTGEIANRILFKVEEGRIEEVKAQFKDAGSVVSLNESSQLLRSSMATAASMLMYIFIVGVMCILLGLVLSYNITGITLRERQTEFSTMMIMGVKLSTISKMLFTEQMVYFVVGIIGGAPISLWLRGAMEGALNSNLFNIHLLVPLSSYLLALGICFTTTCLSVGMTCLSLKSFDPGDALKERG